jgi:nucleoside-diphosphate-sugar epimerase
MGWIEGKAILVTGGTGCIGSALLRELAAHRPGRLASVSLAPGPWPRTGGAEYLEADIRDYPALAAAMAGGWDVVFHTAAQRDPGLAEREVHRTVTTNLFGSLNVLRAAEALAVPAVVFASTGKALRPYSPDMYTATKRAAEWALARSSVPRRAGVRFTHVVDNSILYERLQGWCRYGQPIRLHGDGIWFYVQSATEAAELLMGAAATCTAVPQVHSITDLGMPVSLHDLAVQARDAMGATSPIEITGYDAGYEEVPFPGLADPATAGDVSPLINAFEAAAAWQPYPGVDAHPLDFCGQPPALGALHAACQPADGHPQSALIRAEMQRVSWAVMRCAVAAAPPAAVRRVAVLCKQYEPLPPPHDQMLEIIAGAAGMAGSDWERCGRR